MGVNAIVRRVLFALIAAHAVAVNAADSAQSFNIQPGDLGAALRAYAAQTGDEMLFSDDVVAGRRSPGVTGSFEPQKALDELLKGTGLAADRTADGVVYLKRVAAPVPQAAAPKPRATAQPNERGDVRIPEIIVTAQKREESQQSTPISIAVLTTEALEERGISTLTDLSDGAVPSVRVAPENGRASALAVGMRGLVPTGGSQISRDPTVGIYMDGVYLGRIQGLGAELMDVERLEVLRGTQGTLFGRNAIGGALNFISKKPTGELGLDMTAGLSNFSGRNAAAHLNLPEFAGISIKLDGVYSRRNGWVQNAADDEWDWNEYRRNGFRATALWRPTNDVSLQYAYERSTDKSTGGYGHIDYLLPGAPPLAPVFSLDSGREAKARGAFELNPSVGKVEGHSLHAEWDINSGLLLRSITAYRELDQTQDDNSAGTFLAFRPNGLEGRASFAEVNQDQFSEELQLVGTIQRVKYVVGAFYFDEDAKDAAYARFTSQFNATGTAINRLPVPITTTPFPDRASDVHVKSKALFGQATWTPAVLNDRLHLTGGVRYTSDDKHGRLLQIRGVDAPANLRFDFSSDRIDPMATVAFDVTDSVNAYLRWGKAYRAGGANSRSATFRTFDEESVSSWEIGLKSEFFERHAQLNLAAFHTVVKGLQIDFVSPTNTSATESVNGDRDEKIRGVEADFVVVPGGGLLLSGSYSYVHIDLPAQLNPFSQQLEEIVPPLTPKHAATVAADYRFPIAGVGSWSAHIDANWSSGYFAAPTDEARNNKVVIWNARLALADIAIGAGQFQVSAWGRNLTNREYTLFDFELTGPGLVNGDLAVFNEPRTYGMDLRYRF